MINLNFTLQYCTSSIFLVLRTFCRRFLQTHNCENQLIQIKGYKTHIFFKYFRVLGDSTLHNKSHYCSNCIYKLASIMHFLPLSSHQFTLTSLSPNSALIFLIYTFKGYKTHVTSPVDIIRGVQPFIRKYFKT